MPEDKCPRRLSIAQELQLQRFVRKIGYGVPKIEDYKNADELTRKKWEAEAKKQTK